MVIYLMRVLACDQLSSHPGLPGDSHGNNCVMDITQLELYLLCTSTQIHLRTIWTPPDNRISSRYSIRPRGSFFFILILCFSKFKEASSEAEVVKIFVR